MQNSNDVFAAPLYRISLPCKQQRIIQHLAIVLTSKPQSSLYRIIVYLECIIVCYWFENSRDSCHRQGRRACRYIDSLTSWRGVEVGNTLGMLQTVITHLSPYYG